MRKMIAWVLMGAGYLLFAIGVLGFIVGPPDGGCSAFQIGCNPLAYLGDFLAIGLALALFGIAEKVKPTDESDSSSQES